MSVTMMCRVYTLRENREYRFICDTLGQLNVSLMDNLLQADVSSGLAVEVSECVPWRRYRRRVTALSICVRQASLDFYENLRMGRIYNHTKSDPNSLNIDLDVMMADFDETTRCAADSGQLLCPLLFSVGSYCCWQCPGKY
jgi:hypothetical protein